MSSSCQGLLQSLKECVLLSDCVQKDGLLPSQCIKDHIDELPEKCRMLRQATYDCKRGMLDMRKRFRGNNVGTVGTDYKDKTWSDKSELGAKEKEDGEKSQ